MKKCSIKKRKSSSPHSYANLSYKVKDYENRWSKIFKDLDGTMIESKSFDRIEIDEECEYSSLKLDILILGRGLKNQREYDTLNQRLDDANNRILSYMAKARATSTSTWKDKDRDIRKMLLATLGNAFNALKEIITRLPKIHG